MKADHPLPDRHPATSRLLLKTPMPTPQPTPMKSEPRPTEAAPLVQNHPGEWDNAWLEAQSGIARAFYQLGMLDEAEAALQLPPGVPDRWHGLTQAGQGQIAWARGDMQAVVEICYPWQHLVPQRQVWFAMVATALKNCGRIPEAIALQERGMALNGTTPNELLQPGLLPHPGPRLRQSSTLPPPRAVMGSLRPLQGAPRHRPPAPLGAAARLGRETGNARCYSQFPLGQGRGPSVRPADCTALGSARLPEPPPRLRKPPRLFTRAPPFPHGSLSPGPGEAELQTMDAGPRPRQPAADPTRDSSQSVNKPRL